MAKVKPPSYHEVRVYYLKKVVDNVQKCLEKLEMIGRNGDAH